ncbi:MAG: hypothetical protein ABIT37_18225 [Luteolibacter sp.]
MIHLVGRVTDWQTDSLKTFKLLLMLLAFSLAPLHGATTLPTAEYYAWSFTLVYWGSSPSNLGSVTVGFPTSNKLELGDSMTIKIFSHEATVPFHSFTFTGTNIPSDFVAIPLLDLDDELPGLKGRVELSMDSGTVDLSDITIYVRDGTNQYHDSIDPNVQLVPEPAGMLLAMIPAFFVIRRRR